MLPDKLQRKVVRKATRAIAKKVMVQAKSNTPQDTGAMAKAYQVRVFSKSEKAATGKTREAVAKNGYTYTFNVKRIIAKVYGAKVQISRQSLAKQTQDQVKRGKRKRILTGNEKYFYPAFVELGGGGDSGKKPMRTAMKQLEAQAMQVWRSELRSFIRSERAKGKAK